jgi:hypothetical protein
VLSMGEALGSIPNTHQKRCIPHLEIIYKNTLIMTYTIDMQQGKIQMAGIKMQHFYFL